jgi:hypothetical protein
MHLTWKLDIAGRDVMWYLIKAPFCSCADTLSIAWPISRQSGFGEIKEKLVIDTSGVQKISPVCAKTVLFQTLFPVLSYDLDMNTRLAEETW